MCLKSKEHVCKYANTCLKNHFNVKDLVQFQSDKIKLVV